MRIPGSLDNAYKFLTSALNQQKNFKVITSNESTLAASLEAQSSDYKMQISLQNTTGNETLVLATIW